MSKRLSARAILWVMLVGIPWWCGWSGGRLAAQEADVTPPPSGVADAPPEAEVPQATTLPVTTRAAAGLRGDYYAGSNFETLVGTHTDGAIDFDPARSLGVDRAGGSEAFSVRWKGQVRADAQGQYTFSTVSEGGVRLWVDSVLVIDNWRNHRRTEDAGRIKLRADLWYDVQLEYSARGGGSVIRLLFTPPEGTQAVVPATHLRPFRGIREPYPDPYVRPPDFIEKVIPGRDFNKWKEAMDLSFEPTFYTLTDLHGYSKPEPRSTALVRKGLEKEQQGEYREALEIYQKVIDEYPDDLQRVSRFGIYVPVAQYCQRRLLQFPRKDLAFYRSKHDPRAKEAFEQALRKHSLEGLAEVVDGMLATSYGGPAMLALGDAAMDRGHYLEALEYYSTVEDIFPGDELHGPELGLKIAYCRKMLGEGNPAPAGAARAPAGRGAGAGSPAAVPPRTPPAAEAAGRLPSATQDMFRQVYERARYEKPPALAQHASPPHLASDDYTFFPRTADPLALAPPVWQDRLPGTRLDFFVYTQPVVTDKSVVYRHKNIVYCRSLLNGQLRWQNDLGGRVVWQNWDERQYPQEDLLVQDGLVFTPMYKIGPTLVALDEVTGQLKWAYGPMVAATTEEARLRLEAAPAGGPGTIFAGYVQDNIEGETHIDSEYGVIAFESTTGRIRWRRPICRMRPGLFAAGFAEQRRNRIRSFTSPPLYHEGTVYYLTNAGAVAALDALSGRVKWTMRYPYYAFPDDWNVHDATRKFGQGGDFVQYTKIRFIPHTPMFWYNQRPLLIGERLYLTPVDSAYLFSLDRRTGKVEWTKLKGEETRSRRTPGSSTHFMGTTKSGDLILAYSFRRIVENWAGPEVRGPIWLVDPATGQTRWMLEDPVAPEVQPTVKYSYGRTSTSDPVYFLCLGADRHNYQVSARPFLTDDDKLYVTSFAYWGYPIYGWASNLAVVSLSERKVLARRRYLSGECLSTCENAIAKAPVMLEVLNDLPHKDDRVLAEIKMLEEIIADTVPVNEQGPFLPFSRITAERYGTTMEVRMGPREVAMVYDREAVKRTLADRTDPEGLFARAELALGESRLKDAADLLKECLARISSEDVDFRAMINQQLYEVHKELARSGIRAGRVDDELAHCLGMSRTVGTLADEIETLFSLSEAYIRKGDLEAAERMLRSVVSTYGHYEYPVSSVLGSGTEELKSAAEAVLDRGQAFVKETMHQDVFTRSLALLKKGLPLYFSTLSPLKKDLTVRAGDLGAARLRALEGTSATFRERFEATAAKELAGQSDEVQIYRLWEFPGTRTGQGILDRLFAATAEQLARAKGNAAAEAGARRQLWRLADVGRVSGLTVPSAYRPMVTAPQATPPLLPLGLPLAEREETYASREGTSWLVLERRGQRDVQPDLLFMGGRVKKRFDFKFVLLGIDLKSGQTLWTAQEERGGQWTDELRLKGKGDEAGFFEAFVCGDVVVVHGLYDVLAFNLSDGKLRWRYEVPFDFEIKYAEMSGDLLVLSGKAETLALYLPTADPRGEVVWQEKEEGDVYIRPFFRGDRLVEARKLPFNVTVRYRSTGKLVGRLALPDLSLNETHPLLEDGPRALPVAADPDQSGLLVVTDGWYYIALDVERMKVVWKRLIDQSDVTREPAMRFALKGDYFSVLKEDYDQKAVYMLSSKSGEVLWRTDPKDSRSPQPLHSMLIEGDRLYGIEVHAGQGFYFVGRNAATGERLFRREMKGYQGKPQVALLPRLYGPHAVVTVKDRQDYEVIAFDVKDGRVVHQLKMEGAGEFGEHGRVSATVQNGKLVLLSKDALRAAVGG